MPAATLIPGCHDPRAVRDAIRFCSCRKLHIPASRTRETLTPLQHPRRVSGNPSNHLRARPMLPQLLLLGHHSPAQEAVLWFYEAVSRASRRIQRGTPNPRRETLSLFPRVLNGNSSGAEAEQRKPMTPWAPGPLLFRGRALGSRWPTERS